MVFEEAVDGIQFRRPHTILCIDVHYMEIGTTKGLHHTPNKDCQLATLARSDMYHCPTDQSTFDIVSSLPSVCHVSCDYMITLHHTTGRRGFGG